VCSSDLAAHASEDVVAPLDVPDKVARSPREAELAGYYGALARRFDSASGG